MSGSVYGTIFKISTWGESHGTGVGVVVDSCPDRANLPQPEAKEIRQRSYPVFLREKQQEHQSLL